VLKSFDGGIELRPPGITKARAVEELLNETPSPRTAAYLGDDATDEDAFNALKGKGLSVLVGKEYRPTRADLWLTPPEELIGFLAKWQESCEANSRERAIE
jgi:trehalose-phosphatase